MQPTTSKGRAGVLETGLSILEILSEDPDGLGVTDIADRLGKDKGNTYRILKVLQDRDYIVQDLGTKRYSISTRVLQLAGRTLRSLDVRGVAEPVMQRLQKQSQASIHLTILSSAHAVYVAQERGHNQVHMETAIGSVAPVHCAATGKAIAAHAPSEGLERLVGEEPFERFTDRTITTWRELQRELARIRKRGFSFDDEEYVRDIRGVAAPIMDARGRLLAAVGMSTSARRMDATVLKEFSELISDGAAEITTRLGGSVG